MTLTPNSMLGNYRIGEVIGEGGMVQVYLATDTTLDRNVAIKVLPDSFAQDAERIARFEREAKTLASLNHNNIAQIYGIEKGAVTAIVMELVEGPTLADRIAQGPLPPEEALRIARQIIDGLEAAHNKGIVHRDLKPANIKVTADGLVKILDFGIAKSVDASSNSGRHTPTMVTPAVTESGVIMGTAAYMSPEQARGKFVDQRTDIWAFGCVLYEMLTGQPAFGGQDVAETMARIITLDADTSSLPAMIAPMVRHTIELCLQKDVKKRLADIRDVRLGISGALESAVRGSGGTGAAPAVPQPLSRRLLPHVATLVIGGALIALGVWHFKPEPAPIAQPLNRFAYSLPTNHVLRNLGRPVMAFSPDGRHFVYNTTQGLYLRTLGELEARLIPGTEENLAGPFFSPDGKSIAYLTGEGLKRIAISGGAPVVITAALENLDGQSWGQGDVILFGQDEGIFRVSATGGTPELVIPDQEMEEVGSPELLPDGDTVLFSTRTGGTWDQAQVVAQSLATGVRTVLIQGGSNAHYLPTGHLVYALEDGLFAMAFDLATLTVSGGAVPLVQGLLRATITDSANYGIANDGTLVYVNGTGQAERHNLVWVGRDGSEELINAPPRNYTYAQLSPDSTRVALDSRDEENDIWIFDLVRETLQRLTFDPGMNRSPVWSPDGTRVASTLQLGNAENIYWQVADGSGVPEALTDNAAEIGDSFANSFVPDGSAVLFTNNNFDIWMTTLGGTAPNSTPLLATAAAEHGPAVSPDGRWLAYQSNESGRFEIYVRPFPEVNSGRWQISTNGGTHPDWSVDGSELFYLDLEGDNTQGTGALMAVPIATDTTFVPGTPTQLFAGNFVAPQSQRMVYDVASDGRFLMIKNAASSAGEDSRTEIIIVENFVEELQRLVPTE